MRLFSRMITFDTDGMTLNSLIGFKDTNKLVRGGIEKETESIFQHAGKILDRHGSSLDKGNRVAIFMFTFLNVPSYVIIILYVFAVFSIHFKLADLNDTQIVDDIFKKCKFNEISQFQKKHFRSDILSI